MQSGTKGFAKNFITLCQDGKTDWKAPWVKTPTALEKPLGDWSCLTSMGRRLGMRQATIPKWVGEGPCSWTSEKVMAMWKPAEGVDPQPVTRLIRSVGNTCASYDSCHTCASLMKCRSNPTNRREWFPKRLRMINSNPAKDHSWNSSTESSRNRQPRNNKDRVFGRLTSDFQGMFIVVASSNTIQVSLCTAAYKLYTKNIRIGAGWFWTPMCIYIYAHSFHIHISIPIGVLGCSLAARTASGDVLSMSSQKSIGSVPAAR